MKEKARPDKKFEKVYHLYIIKDKDVETFDQFSKLAIYRGENRSSLIFGLIRDYLRRVDIGSNSRVLVTELELVQFLGKMNKSNKNIPKVSRQTLKKWRSLGVLVKKDGKKLSFTDGFRYLYDRDGMLDFVKLRAKDPFSRLSPIEEKTN